MNQKPLNRTSIQEIAERLMISNLETTTLEVKNQLRKEGFYAEQKEVSRWMLQLATWQNWAMVNAGNHRIYRFKDDSKDAFQNYLEKDNAFWEVRVEGLEVVTGFGKIGEDGILNTQDFKSNRQAIHHGRRILNEILAKGYVEATDNRLSLELRKQYEPYLKLNALKCTLGYYGVKIQEKVEITYRLQNSPNAKTSEGYLIHEKSAGFEFEWTLPDRGSELKHVLEHDYWDAIQICPNQSNLTGGKVLKTQFFTKDHQSMDEPEILEKGEIKKLLSIKINNANLYNIRFEFSEGKPLDLSKFKLDLEKELLPIAKRFLW